jgi:hypothetical protein
MSAGGDQDDGRDDELLAGEVVRVREQPELGGILNRDFPPATFHQVAVRELVPGGCRLAIYEEPSRGERIIAIENSVCLYCARVAAALEIPALDLRTKPGLWPSRHKNCQRLK